MDELLQYRPEFPILENTTYLISNSLGAMPRGVYDSLHGYADSWAEHGVRAWEEQWWDLASTGAEQLSPLIRAAPEEISLHQNVTTTEAVIASRFDISSPPHGVPVHEIELALVEYFYDE